MVLKNIPRTRDNITSYFPSFLKDSLSETSWKLHSSQVCCCGSCVCPCHTRQNPFFISTAVTLSRLLFRKKHQRLVQSNSNNGQIFWLPEWKQPRTKTVIDQNPEKMSYGSKMAVQCDVPQACCCLHLSPALCTLHVDSDKSVESGSWSPGFSPFNSGKTVSLVSQWHLNSWDQVVLPQSPKGLRPQALDCCCLAEF